jgi:hypothetical protein
LVQHNRIGFLWIGRIADLKPARSWQLLRTDESFKGVDAVEVANAALALRFSIAHFSIDQDVLLVELELAPALRNSMDIAEVEILSGPKHQCSTFAIASFPLAEVVLFSFVVLFEHLIRAKLSKILVDILLPSCCLSSSISYCSCCGD